MRTELGRVLKFDNKVHYLVASSEYEPVSYGQRSLARPRLSSQLLHHRPALDDDAHVLRRRERGKIAERSASHADDVPEGTRPGVCPPARTA